MDGDRHLDALRIVKDRFLVRLPYEAEASFSKLSQGKRCRCVIEHDHFKVLTQRRNVRVHSFVSVDGSIGGAYSQSVGGIIDLLARD